MQPIKTGYSNITFTAEGCRDLPATLCRTHEGEDQIETVWELSDEELKQIIKDRRVFVYLHGHHVPALALFTKSQLIFPEDDDDG